MKNIQFVLILFLTQFIWAGENVISRSEYISTWKMVAIEQMNLHGIPASITLAQGILESGNGNSKLAREGNNHFGIKCHNWEGKKMYLDDDAENECFRVYNNAKESYLDHSSFLKKHKRYEFLFSYRSDDYVQWAKGLKQAGYATSPTYAENLIKLIEDEKLFELDNSQLNTSKITKNEFEVNFTQHSFQQNSNGVKYVTVKKGDTFYKLSKELGISATMLRRYNEFHPDKEYLIPGEIVYVQPKKFRSKNEKFILTKDKTTLREISHEKGIRLKSLLHKNNSTTPDQHLPKGTKVFLK